MKGSSPRFLGECPKSFPEKGRNYDVFFVTAFPKHVDFVIVSQTNFMQGNVVPQSQSVAQALELCNATARASALNVNSSDILSDPTPGRK